MVDNLPNVRAFTRVQQDELDKIAVERKWKNIGKLSQDELDQLMAGAFAETERANQAKEREERRAIEEAAALRRTRARGDWHGG